MQKRRSHRINEKHAALAILVLYSILISYKQTIVSREAELIAEILPNKNPKSVPHNYIWVKSQPSIRGMAHRTTMQRNKAAPDWSAGPSET